ncbi:MAG: ABC transporter ATP-binding protein [Salinarimonas sp.]|nr:ABC transporter ATP-binding protein [Salinarimonas sp.]
MIGRQAENLVDGVSFSVMPGETLCIVGESGCGKSVTALALMGLLQTPPVHITSGSVRFDGHDLLGLSVDDWSDLRGDRMAMIFQEPMTALNPAFTIGDQIAESVMRHRRIGAEAARARALEMLERVGIPAARTRLDAYPHQLSGGMRQRAMIAMALANDPTLLIADEPTTALDVTIQAQVLQLIRDLQRESGTALILITHDLGVVAEVADKVAVMYAGRIVETAPVEALFNDPQHPYTIGLIGSLPGLEAGQRGSRLATIPGLVPAPESMPAGCRFADRCPFATATCAEAPPLREIASGHAVACHYAPLEEHCAPEQAA